jgi:hypothetical protein
MCCDDNEVSSLLQVSILQGEISRVAKFYKAQPQVIFECG